MILRSCGVKGSTAAQVGWCFPLHRAIRTRAPASKATKQMTTCSVSIGSSPYFFALPTRCESSLTLRRRHADCNNVCNEGARAIAPRGRSGNRQRRNVIACLSPRCLRRAALVSRVDAIGRPVRLRRRAAPGRAACGPSPLAEPDLQIGIKSCPGFEPARQACLGRASSNSAQPERNRPWPLWFISETQKVIYLS
jgi:hypothetical protein